jgi:hypothetical protein
MSQFKGILFRNHRYSGSSSGAFTGNANLDRNRVRLWRNDAMIRHSLATMCQRCITAATNRSQRHLLFLGIYRKLRAVSVG